jgi:hypothetical protein
MTCRVVPIIMWVPGDLDLLDLIVPNFSRASIPPAHNACCLSETTSRTQQSKDSGLLW